MDTATGAIISGFGYSDGSGQLPKSVAGGSDVTLTAAESAALNIELTGLLTANINIIVPATKRMWRFYNATTGAFTVTVKTAAGTGIAVTQGKAATLESDGTNIIRIVSSGSVATLTDASTIATDASLAEIFDVTLGGNRTLGNPTNAADGMKRIWRIKQDGSGPRTLTLGSNFRLGTDITSTTLTTTAGKTDYLAAIYNGQSGKWDVVSFVKGF